MMRGWLISALGSFARGMNGDDPGGVDLAKWAELSFVCVTGFVCLGAFQGWFLFVYFN